MEIQQQQIFAANIYTTFINSIGESDELNKLLFKQFKASKNFHTYSHPENLRYENTYVPLQHVPAVNAILTTAIEITRTITNQQFQIDKDNWWFNYMNGGDVTNIHNHAPGPYMSGVYYAKAPANSGKLYFTYNRMHIKERDYYNYIGHNFQDVEIEPIEGMMIIFPSWLDHKVEMHPTKESRLSIAFNLRYPHSTI